MLSILSKEGLTYKLETELGIDHKNLKPLNNSTKRRFEPIGVLLHIAAGNMDFLPIYTVIEGLLVGNINLVKLSSHDKGLSLKLIDELLKIEPKLTNFIYLFDIPSSDISSLKKLADISNALVVWGSNEAIKSVRSLASTNTKIIEWGHKLSFAYANHSTTDTDLVNLSHHILKTNQVLCSSVQGIFYDTDNEVELTTFGKRFFEILKETSKSYPKDIGMIGRNTIQIYTEQLKENNNSIYLNEDGVSVCIKFDHELALSFMFRNVWVKPLTKENIITKFHKHKYHLQSCALLVHDETKDEVISKLIRSGVQRITGPNASRFIIGEAHDGTYALREYVNLIEIDEK
ncbi:Acyl-CoA reductase (LuxC) [Acholeplasma hippikon]|uniref:Acyl-CoA reductase (LuxC) n=2 Tax=Acholeplasma hippikon TaxID=264636 RepID=A0A449BJV0_9MOLU|nr:Acyl-CoA reductase (LuxC) [Acholeplasma hippikon]